MLTRATPFTRGGGLSEFSVYYIKLIFNPKSTVINFFINNCMKLDEIFLPETANTVLPYVGTKLSGKHFEEFVDYVSVDELLDIPGNELGKTDIEALKQAIQAEGGLREPVVIIVGKNDRRVSVGEGNHRVQAAKELGYRYMPARVMVYAENGGFGSWPRTDLIPEPQKYFSADARPSDVFTRMDMIRP